MATTSQPPSSVAAALLRLMLVLGAVCALGLVVADGPSGHRGPPVSAVVTAPVETAERLPADHTASRRRSTAPPPAASWTAASDPDCPASAVETVALKSEDPAGLQPLPSPSCVRGPPS